MKLLQTIILTLLLISCEERKDTTIQNKPVNAVVGLNDLTNMLANEIDHIAAEEYMNLSQKSKDSISITLENLAYKLYKIKEKSDSLSQEIVKQAIIKSKKMSEYSAVRDTQFSYRFVLNNFESYFPKTFIADQTAQNSFEKLINYQTDIIQIRQLIVKTHKGNGQIYCGEIGDKIAKSDLDAVSDYWDLFNLIERTRYTLFKEILFTYTNLKYYNTEIKYKYSLGYDDTIPDVSKWTPK